MRIGAIKAVVKGFKRTCTPYEKERFSSIYGKDLERLPTEFNLYKKDGSFPYSFYDYNTSHNVQSFKSIDAALNHLKKWQFQRFNVELTFVEE